MDLESLRKLAAEHPYVVLAFLIGLVVRLLKSDTKIPIDIPPQWRRPLAVLLAAGGAVVEKLAIGTPTGQAVFDGTVAWAIAEFGHYFVVDKLRDGKELPIPFLTIPGASPAPGKPASIPPKKGPPSVPPGITSLIAVVYMFSCIGCMKFWKAADLAADKVKCLVANQDLPNDTLFLKCAIEEPERYLELLESSRAETKRAVARERERAASDRSDAGCEAGK